MSAPSTTEAPAVDSLDLEDIPVNDMERLRHVWLGNDARGWESLCGLTTPKEGARSEAYYPGKRARVCATCRELADARYSA